MSALNVIYYLSFTPPMPNIFLVKRDVFSFLAFIISTKNILSLKSDFKMTKNYINLKINLNLYNFFVKKSGNYLSSQQGNSQVFSASKSLTSVFGMGTGGSSLSLSPENI